MRSLVRYVLLSEEGRKAETTPIGTVGGIPAVPISSLHCSSAGNRCSCPRPPETSHGRGDMGDGHPRIVEAAAKATTAEPRRPGSAASTSSVTQIAFVSLPAAFA